MELLPAEGAKTLFSRLRLRYRFNMADKRTSCFHYFPKILNDLYNLQGGVTYPGLLYPQQSLVIFFAFMGGTFLKVSA